MSASFRDRSYRVPNTDLVIQAEVVFLSSSDDNTAWLGGRYTTLRLLNPMQAFRLHGSGAAFDAPEGPRGKWISKRAGAWFALGDVMIGSTEFHEKASLPHSFSILTAFILPEGTLMNVGIASNRFHGRRGGMIQGEVIHCPGDPRVMAEGYLMLRAYEE